MSNPLRDFRCELTHRLRFGDWEWRYQLEGRDGAVEFWCRRRSDRSIQVLGPDAGPQTYGGFEVHRALPGASDGAPSHGRCSALSDRACWHDGSSLYAAEFWVPKWDRDPNDHEAIFVALAAEYRKRFDKEPTA